MLNTFIDSFITSSCASIFSKTASAPVELWRIQRQNPFIPNTTLRDVIKKEGLRYIWKGNGVNIVKASPQYALTYALFNQFHDNFDNSIVSGTVAGACSMGLIYPLEITRTYLSLQTNKNKYKGIVDVLKKNKIKDLYKGYGTSIFGFSLFSGLMFQSRDYLNKEYPNSPFNGGIASIYALTFSYPTDLIRRRLQLQGFDKTVPKYNGAIDCVKKIINTEGISGLYRGLYANYVKSFIQWGIHFYLIDLFNSLKQKQSS
jgi:hypothetical protein